MKLSNIWFKPELNIDPDKQKLDDSGILEAHRFIYLFFNKNDIENDKNNNIIQNSQINGKAIQINLSISKGGGNNIDIMPWIRGSNNSTYMTMNLYIYDTVFDTHIRNFRSAEFTLDTSLSSSTTNDYDIKRALSNGARLYSRDLKNNSELTNIVNNSLFANSPYIPEPMYYTMKQMETETNDAYCLTCLGNTVFHTGYELIDNNTRISIMDTSVMDSMNLSIRNKMYEISHMNKQSDFKVNMFDTNEFSTNMLFQDIESMQNGFIYMYDSDMGRNILKSNGSYIPFSNYQITDKIEGDLQRTIDTVEQSAKLIEKKFGHIRIQYSPLYYGNKLDVYFKDYKPDNQPIIKENTSVDNGTRIFDEISNRISDIESDPDDYNIDGNGPDGEELVFNNDPINGGL